MLPLESQRVFALTVVLGVMCGLAAVAFHLAIEVVSRLAIDRALAAPGRSWIGWTLAVPAGGGLVSGVLLQYLFPNARGSGIPQVKAAYATRVGRLRLRDSVGKFFVSALQIGTGSSLGREGPTVHICAGLAVWMGRLVRVSPAVLRRLLPVGAAAGIAAAFNAPIAAVTFTIEEVVGVLDQTVLSGVIVAAAVAAVVERSVLGSHPVFDVPHGMQLEGVTSLLIYGLLGVAAAAVSIAFTDSLLGLRRRFRDMRRVPPWVQPALGAVATGALALVARGWLETGGVTGGGYATLGAALTGKLAVSVLVPLCLMKLAATVLSYSSGGAGGIFAPALFIGGMLGGAVGALDVQVLGHSSASLGAFALVGMGAVFAGIIRAPITSVLIIIEMTDGYALILPLMIANMLAYGIARHYRPAPIYEALLAQDGIDLRPRTLADTLAGVRVGDVPLDTRPCTTFAPTTDLPAMLASLSRSDRQELFPVVTGVRLVGMVTLADLVALSSEPHLGGLVNAADVMRAPVQLRREDGLRTAFEAMLENGVRELPVTDEEERLLGFVDERSIAHACGKVAAGAPS
ncbi:MAG: chloride channel protein [Deltaproteobacteria bacterium]|nr:chloride channel protein [Deltaproteobacteria bacterium]